MADRTSVGEDMPRLQAEVREILQTYRDLGPRGAFGAFMIEHDLQEADEAMASGNPVRILRAYQVLKEIK